jgi:hypothetical protein
MEKISISQDNKYLKLFLIAASAYLIYKFGTNCGEFIYYISH